MKDNFSCKRFGLLAQAELSGERRSLLLRLGGFLVFCCVMYMLWNIKVIFGGASVEDVEGVGYVAPRFFVFIGLLFVIYFNLSGSFKHFFSRGNAPASFMLPASQSEKFLYAALLNLVVIPVVLIGIVLLNDMLWAHLLGFDHICRDISTLSEKIYTSEQAVLFSTGFVVANIVSIFSGMAFFLAGSVVFRRNQFLLTLLVNFLLSIPYFIPTHMVGTNPQSMKDIFLWLGSDAGIWTTAGLGVFFTLLWMYVAWRRFSTLQITK